MKAPVLWLLALLFVIPCSLRAQNPSKERKVHRLELEAGAGFEFAYHNKYVPGNEANWRFELRYNFRSVPINIGFQFQGSKSQNFGNHNNSYLLMADYNFCRGRMVNPYVGLGTGPVEDGGWWSINPRLGIRFFRHVFVEVNYLKTGYPYSHAHVMAGLYF